MTQLKDPKGILIGLKLWYYERSKYMNEFKTPKIGHLCLYILHKEEIWSGVTDALLTH